MALRGRALRPPHYSSLFIENTLPIIISLALSLARALSLSLSLSHLQSFLDCQ